MYMIFSLLCGIAGFLLFGMGYDAFLTKRENLAPVRVEISKPDDYTTHKWMLDEPTHNERILLTEKHIKEFVKFLFS